MTDDEARIRIMNERAACYESDESDDEYDEYDESDESESVDEYDIAIDLMSMVADRRVSRAHLVAMLIDKGRSDASIDDLEHEVRGYIRAVIARGDLVDARREAMVASEPDLRLCSGKMRSQYE